MVTTLPSFLLFFHEKYIFDTRALFQITPTYFVQSVLRRGGRNRIATDKSKLPVGRSKRDDAHWKERERHWAGWSKEDRDAKMAETFTEREAAREELAAEQMQKEDEWLVRISSSPAPTATQVIFFVLDQTTHFPATRIHISLVYVSRSA